MNTIMEHKGIRFEVLMNEQPTLLVGRGWVHLARLIGRYNRTQLRDLVGMELWGDPVLAVESFAIENQVDRPIGLLLANKKW